MRDRIDQFSAKNKSPQCGALGNKYSVCGVNFPEPRAEVYCVRLNFISDRKAPERVGKSFPLSRVWHACDVEVHG